MCIRAWEVSIVEHNQGIRTKEQYSSSKLLSRQAKGFIYHLSSASKLFCTIEHNTHPKLIPCLITCHLISHYSYALTLTSFWLPQDSAGKASLATTIFLASCVQLLVVADYTPPSASSVPIIGELWVVCLTTYSWWLHATICIISAYHRWLC